MKTFALSAIILGSALAAHAQQPAPQQPPPSPIADLSHAEQTTLENYQLKKQLLDSKVVALRTQIQDAYVSLNKEAQADADAIIAEHKQTGKVVFDPNTFALAPAPQPVKAPENPAKK
jgi:deoxycytidine triphosphate deaminase